MAEREGIPVEDLPNSRAFLEKASASEIDLGIENGTITNPDAVEILVQKQWEEEKRDLENDANEQPERVFDGAVQYANADLGYGRFLTGQPKELARYCAEQAQQHTNYCVQRAEMSITRYFNSSDEDFAAYGTYALQAAAEHYEIASRWYAMGARVARRKQE